MTVPPGYAVKHERVAVAAGADLEIRSLLDREQFSNPLGEAEAAGIGAASWPLFGLVWPSAQKLADLMQVCELDGRRILEIGCGLGLASLLIHRRLGDVTARIAIRSPNHSCAPTWPSTGCHPWSTAPGPLGPRATNM